MCFLLLEHNQKNTDNIAEEVTGMQCMSNLISVHVKSYIGVVTLRMMSHVVSQSAMRI